MLKLAGGMMTVCGCIGLGYWYRQQFIGRIRHLKILIAILDMMMSEVRYGKASLPECCRQIAGRLPEPYGECFEKIWLETQENAGLSYHEIFVGNMKECIKRVPLETEECRLFLELSARFGYEEARMQLNCMEQCKEELKRIVQRLEEEVAQKGRLAIGLGTMGGFLLTLILL